MKPTSSLVMPMLPNTSATTGMSISTSLRASSRRTLSYWAKDTTPTGRRPETSAGELAHRYSL